MILGLILILSWNRGFDGPASLSGAPEVSVACPSSLDRSSGEAAVRVGFGIAISEDPLSVEVLITTLRFGLVFARSADDGPIGSASSSPDVSKCCVGDPASPRSRGGGFESIFLI